MFENRPIKAVANGEPTYERMNRPDRAAGWWQGHEAWSQLMAGGTMGVVYGAAGLWQWKLDADEPGWPDWANAPASWRDALDYEGSRYVGLLSTAFAGFDFTDMTKRPDLASGLPCLAIPGRFYALYLPEGGPVTLSGLDADAPLPYRWFDPKAGSWTEGSRTDGPTLSAEAPGDGPWVLMVGERSEWEE